MSKGKILVVEDEFVVAESLRTELESMGFEVSGPATSGEEAVDLARKNRPNLALMDIKLQGKMDGIEAATRLRHEIEIPSLFLTAFANEDFLERAKAAEPLGYVVKPFERKGLRASIEMAEYKARMERLVKESERRFRSMFENLPVAYCALDESLRFVDCNAELCSLLGYTLTELAGRSIIELCPPEVRQRHRDQLEEVKDRGCLQIEMQLLHRDCTPLTVLLDGRGQHDSNGVFLRLHGILHNITERKRTEEERIHIEQRLQQAKKEESLARMAKAVAHNFNNMLAVVQGNLELAQDGVAQGSELQEYIQDAMNASHRAAEISRFMLTYLGQTEVKFEPIDLSKAVRDTCTLLNVSMLGGIRLKTVLPSAGPVIKGDRALISRIVSNLVSNSVEAMKEGGEITVSLHLTSCASISKSKVFPLCWEPKAQEYACLCIADTGIGIDEATLDMIFDPFFSTKFAGRGLGLPIVLGIARTFDGAIGVESRPGHGTIISVFFPVLQQKLPEVKAEPSTAASLGAGGGLVLVVDDEEIVCKVAEAMLKRKLGYEVVTAGSGAEALEIFKARQDEICLVLLDLSMPGMNGWETLAALRKIRSDISVILSSGYDEAHVSQEAQQEKPQAFLAKPYSLKELAAAIGSLPRLFENHQE